MKLNPNEFRYLIDSMRPLRSKADRVRHILMVTFRKWVEFKIRIKRILK
jgi:hypothetical protein